MTPERAAELGEQIKAAEAANDEQLSARAAIELVVGVAVNIARIAEILALRPEQSITIDLAPGLSGTFGGARA